MSFVTRQAAHCDQCSHEWLIVGASTPTHCAKCKSRRWNSGAAALPDAKLVTYSCKFCDEIWLPKDGVLCPNCGTRADYPAEPKEPEAVGSIPTAPIKPNMQALRDICAGVGYEPPADLSFGGLEISICGKTWWEDGEQYECLMDKGHRESKIGKHGMRGMVRRVDA